MNLRRPVIHRVVTDGHGHYKIQDNMFDEDEFRDRTGKEFWWRWLAHWECRRLQAREDRREARLNRQWREDK